MRLMTCVALGLMLATQPALAAWETKEVSEDYYVAWEVDDSNYVELNIDCDTEFYSVSVALISGEKWDADTEYPKTVDVSFEVGGDTYSSIVFGVEEVEGYVAVIAYELDDPAVYSLIEVFGVAVNPITATIVDDTYTFGVEGVTEAAAFILDACSI